MNSFEHRRNIGLTIGALWLIVITVGFAALSVAMTGTPPGECCSSGRLPPRTTEEKRPARWFGVIVGGELIVIMVVNTICVLVKRLELIVPLDLAVVGIQWYVVPSIGCAVVECCDGRA